jgi:DNA-binding IclR family transcriptional regulator
MESLSRCFAVLERLGTGRPATHADLMRDLGIPRSTLSDLLDDLRKLGLVTRRGRHHLAGPALLSFVIRLGGRLTGPGGMHAVLAELSERFGETVAFVLPAPGSDGTPDQVVAVDQVVSRHELRYVADIGRLFPALPRVAGRVLITYAPEMTDTLPGEERARILSRGYAVNENDERGATTIAAPVFDAGGRAVGAISVIGPAARMQGRVDAMAADLLAATVRHAAQPAAAPGAGAASAEPGQPLHRHDDLG